MQKYIIGNWKMSISRLDVSGFLAKFATLTKNTLVQFGIASPFVFLDELSNASTNIWVGAQNVSEYSSGAYTGEISANMLNDFNCDLVIIGHSERRSYFHETDEDVNLKVKKALEAGLTPILCFGETLEEREGNMAFSVVERQIIGALADLTSEDVERIIFAYEPVWAIGTGVSATSEQAEEMIAFAKRIIAEQFEINSSIVLYGGSLKPSNAEDILSKPSIDGGLIGGACLKLSDFEQLINVKVE